MFGWGFVIVNMVVWMFNLLGFLLFVYLFFVMRMYYDLERLFKEYWSWEFVLFLGVVMNFVYLFYFLFLYFLVVEFILCLILVNFEVWFFCFYYFMLCIFYCFMLLCLYIIIWCNFVGICIVKGCFFGFLFFVNDRKWLNVIWVKIRIFL